MLKIKLGRVGGKKQPGYRIMVADIKSAREGPFVSVIGYYNPLTDPATVVIDDAEARHWLERGAQPTGTAARLLAKAGIIERPEQTIKPEPKAEPEEKIKPEEKT